MSNKVTRLDDGRLHIRINDFNFDDALDDALMQENLTYFFSGEDGWSYVVDYNEAVVYYFTDYGLDAWKELEENGEVTLPRSPDTLDEYRENGYEF